MTLGKFVAAKESSGVSSRNRLKKEAFGPSSHFELGQASRGVVT